MDIVKDRDVVLYTEAIKTTLELIKQHDTLMCHYFTKSYISKCCSSDDDDIYVYVKPIRTTWKPKRKLIFKGSHNDGISKYDDILHDIYKVLKKLFNLKMYYD